MRSLGFFLFFLLLFPESSFLSPLGSHSASQTLKVGVFKDLSFQEEPGLAPCFSLEEQDFCLTERTFLPPFSQSFANLVNFASLSYSSTPVSEPKDRAPPVIS